jgi:hypothetical protein
MSVTRNVTTLVREFGKFYVKISFSASGFPDHRPATAPLRIWS